VAPGHQADVKSGNAWTSQPRSAHIMGGAGVGGASGLIYAIGGRNETSALATNERFSQPMRRIGFAPGFANRGHSTRNGGKLRVLTHKGRDA
jgi:hypothetical protein